MNRWTSSPIHLCGSQKEKTKNQKCMQVFLLGSDPISQQILPAQRPISWSVTSHPGYKLLIHSPLVVINVLICVDIDRMSLMYVTVAVGESNVPHSQAVLLSVFVHICKRLFTQQLRFQVIKYAHLQFDPLLLNWSLDETYPLTVTLQLVRASLSSRTQRKLASHNGWEMMSHVNLHIYDLLMWLSIFSYICMAVWLSYSVLSLFVSFAHFFLVDSLSLYCWFIGMFLTFQRGTFCQLFIQMPVGIWKTLFHLVKFINLILYALNFFFI